ncbi:MAG: hypothetical protein ACK4WK_02580 [Anaerolineae bacterium]
MSVIINDVAVANLALSSQEGNPPLWVGDGAWTPVAPGEYRLFVRMTSPAGAFDSESVRVRVVGTPTPTPLLSGTSTPGAATPLAPLLELSADSTSLTAGECTFLRWRVDISQAQSIDLNGQQVPPQGEMQVCPCFTTQYDLIVLAGDKYAQSVTVQVSGSCIVPTTPPPPVNNALNFWADSTTVQAGSCTFLRWDSVNALKVYLDGQEVSTSGNKRICPCNTNTYGLAASFADGSKQERSLTINVSGSCQSPPVTVPPPPTEPPPPPPTTPPPPQDTTPPPVPAPLSPGSGSENNPPTQYCPVTLQWYPVSDPSGVTYQVRLDKRNNAGTWSTIGTWNTSATQYAVPNNLLFCDYTDYRWRVRAVDGAGNSSNWSVWFYFAMPVP